jgi:hypothetical protein
MQVLKLVSIDGLAAGGSSKPLLITAVAEDKKAKQYVVKLFKTDNIEQNYSVAKEIFINELAKEFALSVPDYALIKIRKEDILNFYEGSGTELTDDELDRINKLDNGYKFCSEFMGQYLIFSPLVSLPFIKDYDIENLFCFDNLVLNVDRGGYRDKPNLLINDREILLIDHELTLPFINNTSENPNYHNYIRNYQYERHILTRHLRALRSKDNLFVEFFESLRYIRIDKFNTLFDEMDDYKINYGDRNKIFAYLNWAKTNIIFLNSHFTTIVK